MERLTVKWKDECYDTLDPIDIVDNDYSKINYEKLLVKLGEYEDSEENGSLVKLPFRLGTPIYKVCYAPQINDGFIYETMMTLKYYADNASTFEERLVYSNKTEAEQVLQRMKAGGKYDRE